MKHTIVLTGGRCGSQTHSVTAFGVWQAHQKIIAKPETTVVHSLAGHRPDRPGRPAWELLVDQIACELGADVLRVHLGRLEAQQRCRQLIFVLTVAPLEPCLSRPPGQAQPISGEVTRVGEGGELSVVEVVVLQEGGDTAGLGCETRVPDVGARQLEPRSDDVGQRETVGDDDHVFG